MNETIRGLLTQKGNSQPPTVGEVRRFSWQMLPTGSGKSYIKVRNDRESGTICEILSSIKTDYADQHGNVSYNIEFRVSSVSGGHTESGANAQRGRTANTITKDDYWQRKEDRDREWQAEQVRNKPRIERQHSQSVAIAYAQLKGLTAISHDDLQKLIDFFQRDIERSPAPVPVPQPEREPSPEELAGHGNDNEEDF